MLLVRMQLLEAAVSRGGRCAAAAVFFIGRRLSALSGKKNSLREIFQVLVSALCLMAMIAVLSVMNGFQMSFVRALVELDTYHVRVDYRGGADPLEYLSDAQKKEITIISHFSEAQGIICGAKSNLRHTFESGAPFYIRFVSRDILKDKGFLSEMKVLDGEISFSRDSILLGVGLANDLGVRAGDEVEAFLFQNSSIKKVGKSKENETKNKKTENKNPIEKNKRLYKVAGIFQCAYYPLNEGYAWGLLDEEANSLGLKLKDKRYSSRFAHDLRAAGLDARTYEEQNRSYFGALRTEKSILSILMLLIIVVIAVNIYSSTRRSVFLKTADIAILYVLGISKSEIKWVFIIRTLLSTLLAVALGVTFGLILSKNMGNVFWLLAQATNAIEKIKNNFSSGGLGASEVFLVYASIASVVEVSDVALFSIWMLFVSIFSAARAALAVLNLNILEAISNE